VSSIAQKDQRLSYSNHLASSKFAFPATGAAKFSFVSAVSLSEDSIPNKMSYVSAIRDLLIINRGFGNFFCNIVKHQCAFYPLYPIWDIRFFMKVSDRTG
jgi:hypothetical protein